MINKNILLLFFVSLLLTSANSIASPVPVTLQFKNDDSQGEAIILTKQPLVDNFDWKNSNSEYKAVWNLPNGDKSFKDIEQPIKLLPGQSISAFLSYRWNDRWYGLSQYSFNYENRPKEYGCFITEARISGLVFESRNSNRVIVSYRQDPNHPDDYLTCSVEKNTNSSFTIHMTSSKNKADEKNIANDSQRYSQVGDVDRLIQYGVYLPIELWKDEKDNKSTALVLSLTSANAVPYINYSSRISYEFYYRLRLVNLTNQVIVAGEPIYNNWKNFYGPSDLAPYSISESDVLLYPKRIEPNQTDVSPVILNTHGGENSAVRMNYHFEGYQEWSGCYILVIGPDRNNAVISTYYNFDSAHPEKNLYCFISVNPALINSGTVGRVTITFYDNFNSIKEVLLLAPTDKIVSYFIDDLQHPVNSNVIFDSGQKIKETSGPSGGVYNKYSSFYK